MLTGVGALAAVLAAFAGTVNLAVRGYEVSLGEYNVAGALVLAAVGGLMLTASRRGSPMLATAAAARAVVAAASIYLQVGIGTSVWPGANLTTAALLLAVVAVAASSGRGSWAAGAQAAARCPTHGGPCVDPATDHEPSPGWGGERGML